MANTFERSQKMSTPHGMLEVQSVTRQLLSKNVTASARCRLQPGTASTGRIRRELVFEYQNQFLTQSRPNKFGLRKTKVQQIETAEKTNKLEEKTIRE